MELAGMELRGWDARTADPRPVCLLRKRSTSLSLPIWVLMETGRYASSSTSRPRREQVPQALRRRLRPAPGECKWWADAPNGPGPPAADRVGCLEAPAAKALYPERRKGTEKLGLFV